MLKMGLFRAAMQYMGSLLHVSPTVAVFSPLDLLPIMKLWLWAIIYRSVVSFAIISFFFILPRARAKASTMPSKVARKLDDMPQEIMDMILERVGVALVNTKLPY